MIGLEARAEAHAIGDELRIELIVLVRLLGRLRAG
jgi:hypothetical protein